MILHVLFLLLFFFSVLRSENVCTVGKLLWISLIFLIDKFSHCSNYLLMFPKGSYSIIHHLDKYFSNLFGIVLVHNIMTRHFML